MSGREPFSSDWLIPSGATSEAPLMDDLEKRVHDVLTADDFLQKLADSDRDEFEPMLFATLRMVDATLELVRFKETAQGDDRQVEVEWRSPSQVPRKETLVLPKSSI
jgi:hypothetical protein